MEKISKTEMEYLISKLILKQFHGNYGDQLIITGKFGNARGKTRYITTPTYNYLLRLQEQRVTDIDKIKNNQKYLFSSISVSVS